MIPARLDGWRLRFNCWGGYGNIEPVDDVEEAPKSLSRHIKQPRCVHGALLKLNLDDFKTLCGMERGYHVKPILQ